MTTKAGDGVFLDTCVLIHATVSESPWYERARSALTKRSAETAHLWISRQVIREYVAVMILIHLFPSS